MVVDSRILIGVVILQSAKFSVQAFEGDMVNLSQVTGTTAIVQSGASFI